MDYVRRKDLKRICPSLGKEIINQNLKKFQFKGGNSMFDYNLDDAFSSALSIAENEEMSMKMTELNNKIENMTSTLMGEKEEEEAELVPTWLDKALDLEFLSPEDKEEYEKYDSLNNTLTGQLNGIYLEIERLNNDRLRALKDFDIPTVVEIDTKLQQLSKDYKEKYASAEDARKEIMSKKNEWEISLDDLSNSLKGETWDIKKSFDASKYQKSVVKEYKKNKTFEMVKDFVEAFPADKRKDVLRNPRIKEMLDGDYNKLVAEYM